MVLQEAVTEAQGKFRQLNEEGADQTALGATAAKEFDYALFDYDADEVSLVIEEFYPIELRHQLRLDLGILLNKSNEIMSDLFFAQVRPY